MTSYPDDLLDEVEAFLARFVAHPSGAARVAHVLWAAHAHMMNAFEATPRLAFLSPEPASGKTRAMEITELLVPRPVAAVNVTSAYLFRKVADPDGAPTILFDEIDTVFGPRAKENEELRGLLNAGHRRGAVAGRCVVKGKAIETEEIPAYCAVAMAGLGGLPDTLLSRSVVVRMKRRAPDEIIEPFRRREHEPIGHRLRDRLADWAAAVWHEVRDMRPLMPEGVDDRDADIWEPLLAVADAAGGAWPERARVSAVSLVSDSKGNRESLGVRLLADVREVFPSGAETIASVELLSLLHEIDDAPWADLRGKPLDSRGLSRRLGDFGVSPRQVRVGSRTMKGYRREDFYDAWARYLPRPNVSDSDDNPLAYPKSQLCKDNENGSLPGTFSLFPHASETRETEATDGTAGLPCSRCGTTAPPERYDLDGCAICARCASPPATEGRCADCGGVIYGTAARCAECAGAAVTAWKETRP